MPRTVKRDKNLAPGQPAKPDNLSARASLEWDRLVGELAASNIRLTPGHRTLLSQAATIAADVADAWKVIQKDGAYISGKAGLVAHPASKRLDALRRDYIKVLSMLGLRAAVPTERKGNEPTLEDILDEQ
jgi:phage terminase small subunit